MEGGWSGGGEGCPFAHQALLSCSVDKRLPLVMAEGGTATHTKFLENQLVSHGETEVPKGLCLPEVLD